MHWREPKPHREPSDFDAFGAFVFILALAFVGALMAAAQH